VAESEDDDRTGFCSVATPSRDVGADGVTPKIGALSVDPEHWRQGTASATLAVALEGLGRRDWREVILRGCPRTAVRWRSAPGLASKSRRRRKVRSEAGDPSFGCAQVFRQHSVHHAVEMASSSATEGARRP
jgi:hypothetical protein